MSTVQTIIDERAMQNVTPYPLCITRGKGYYLFDDQGRSYIDMHSAVAVCNFGHGHPRLLEVLREQTERICMVPRFFYNDALAKLLDKACTVAGMERAIPMNSGAEAVETGIKAARKWAYTVKGIERGTAEILVCDGNFHGRTIAAISMSSVEQYKNDFIPLVPGFRLLPYNNIEALAEAIRPHTAALIIEAIQGEAGVVLPDASYLSACQKLCREHNVLLICDEIQTGMGRTGAMFAYEHAGIHPDGVFMGKALGGGIVPISLFLARGKLATVFSPGDHGSTFGGNPLASRIAYESLSLLFDEELIERAKSMGEYFLEGLRSISGKHTSDPRGKGLMLGITIDPEYKSVRDYTMDLIRKGVLAMPGRNNTLRLLPPLVIDKTGIDKVFSLW